MATALEQIASSLRHLYPRPAINQAWLKETLAALLAESPGLSRQLQIKGCHRALLQSNLAHSAISGTGFPTSLVVVADDEPLHDQVILSDIKGCLVMVVGITEVGSSAFNLRKTLQERREARKGTARIRRLAGEDDDEEDENDAGTSLRYQRGMLKLDLSDGLTVCKAIEYKRIDALKLGETRLGTKLLLRNVRVLRGLLLLTPESCMVKSEPSDGLFDDAWDEAAFDRSLRDRLGLGPEAEEAAEGRPRPPVADAQNDEMDDYIPDDFELPDALAPQPSRPAGRPAPRPTPTTVPTQVVHPPSLLPVGASALRVVQGRDDDSFDDIDDWDEDALIAAAEAEAAEDQLQRIREYERPPPSLVANLPPAVAALPQASPRRPSSSPKNREASHAQAVSSTSLRKPVASRPDRPVSPSKPLFPPFTASITKKRASGSIFSSSAQPGPSTSSQKPTSQLEPVLITSSPEAERPALPKAIATRKKTVPIKRTAPVASIPAASTTGRRVKGRPTAAVESIGTAPTSLNPLHTTLDPHKRHKASTPGATPRTPGLTPGGVGSSGPAGAARTPMGGGGQSKTPKGGSGKTPGI